MFGLAEKAQMMMHEKTLRYAVEHASLNIEGRAEMAGSIQNAINSLSRALHESERRQSARSLLMHLNPNLWNSTSTNLIRAAEQARTKHGLALYYSFTVLAGIVESRIIEVKQPRMATRVMAFRHEALLFVEDMLGFAQQLMGAISATTITNDTKVDDRLKSHATQEIIDKYNPSEYKILMGGILYEFKEHPSSASEQEWQMQLIRATDRLFERVLADYVSNGGVISQEELRHLYNRETDRKKVSIVDNLIAELAGLQAETASDPELN
jgi:hypothetical protein